MYMWKFYEKISKISIFVWHSYVRQHVIMKENHGQLRTVSNLKEAAVRTFPGGFLLVIVVFFTYSCSLLQPWFFPSIFTNFGQQIYCVQKLLLRQISGLYRLLAVEIRKIIKQQHSRFLSLSIFDISVKWCRSTNHLHIFFGSRTTVLLESFASQYFLFR